MAGVDCQFDDRLATMAIFGDHNKVKIKVKNPGSDLSRCSTGIPDAAATTLVKLEIQNSRRATEKANINPHLHS